MLATELHWASRMVALPWMLRNRQAAELALLGSMLFNGGGYIPIRRSFDPGCVPCVELVYAKVVCD